MSPATSQRAPTPAASSLVERIATTVGGAVLQERRRRKWTAQGLATRARVSRATVTNVEAGRRASLDVYARLAVALGLSLEVALDSRRRRGFQQQQDLVHAAMGELEARWLGVHDYEIAIDHPYQHFQFAGRADVLAWTTKPATLLHIENRTRFPDLQDAAGSYNAKRQYLAADLARQLGIRRVESQTHVMVGLWSAEVLHAVRLRRATFRALCPDPGDRLAAWLAGTPPSSGRSSTFILLDPAASGRQASTIELERAIGGAKPRFRGYADAARALAPTRPRR